MWMQPVLSHLVSWPKTVVWFTEIYPLCDPGLGGISMGVGASAALQILPILICWDTGNLERVEEKEV